MGWFENDELSGVISIYLKYKGQWVAQLEETGLPTIPVRTHLLSASWSYFVERPRKNPQIPDPGNVKIHDFYPDRGFTRIWLRPHRPPCGTCEAILWTRFRPGTNVLDFSIFLRQNRWHICASFEKYLDVISDHNRLAWSNPCRYLVVNGWSIAYLHRDMFLLG